jgi:hypothetical protein
MTFSKLVQDEQLRAAVISDLRAVVFSTAKLWDSLRDCEAEYGKDIEYKDNLVGLLAGEVGDSVNPSNPERLSDETLLQALDDACVIEE